MGVAFSLVTFFWPSKRKLLARRGDYPARDGSGVNSILEITSQIGLQPTQKRRNKL